MGLVLFYPETAFSRRIMEVYVTPEVALANVEAILNGASIPTIKFIEEGRQIVIEAVHFEQNLSNPYLEESKIFLTLRMSDEVTGQAQAYMVFFPSKNGQMLRYASSYKGTFTYSCLQILDLLKGKIELIGGDFNEELTHHISNYNRLEKYKAGVLLHQKKVEAMEKVLTYGYGYISTKMEEVASQREILTVLANEDRQIALYLERFDRYKAQIMNSLLEFQADKKTEDAFIVFKDLATNFIRNTIALQERLSDESMVLPDFLDLDFSSLYANPTFVAYIGLFESSEFTAYSVLTKFFGESVSSLENPRKICQAFNGGVSGINRSFWEFYNQEGDWLKAANLLWGQLKEELSGSDVASLVEKEAIVTKLFRQLGIFQEADSFKEIKTPIFIVSADDSDLLLQLRNSLTFGERITLVREFRGLTPERLSQMASNQLNTVYGLESDQNIYSPRNAPVIAQALDIDVWYLLQGMLREEALEVENIIPRIPLIEIALWGENRIIGERIILSRIAQGRTQEELAETLGVSPSELSAWERGRKNVPQDNIADLAFEININIELLQEVIIPDVAILEIEHIGPVSFIGARIKSRREELGLSSKDLADLVGWSSYTLMSLERGEFDIRINLPTFAEMLNMDAWELLTGSEKDMALETENLKILISPLEFKRWGKQVIIGERLRLARLVKGYSLIELGRIIVDSEFDIGSHASRLISGVYERGVVPLPQTLVEALSSILDLDPLQLQP